MITPEKIEEWIKEVEGRPSSAPIIIQYIANRLQDLTGRNEKLREDNIALRTGKKVTEYEQEIAHLEHQLEMLKRRLGGELPDMTEIPEEGEGVVTAAVEILNLLVYNTDGRIGRIELPRDALSDGMQAAEIATERSLDVVIPRMLVVPSSEELLFVFSSGRIGTMPVADIPSTTFLTDEGSPHQIQGWGSLSLPLEPAVGETLSSVVPIARMALMDGFIQVSRRGYAKKILNSLSPSIMSNKYIGTGTKRTNDESFEVLLPIGDENLVLVSREGYIQSLSLSMLPYAVVEAMRLGDSDHLVGAFTTSADCPILILTQIGKSIHREGGSLELADALNRKGKAMLSTSRRAKGVRVIGGAAVADSDWLAVLHKDGAVTLHKVSSLFATGTITTGSELLAMAAFAAVA